MKRRMRCLVVDDSALYRKIVREVLAGMPDVEVVGVANDGRRAVDQIAALQPDLVTLDLEMPRLDGIGVLRELKDQGIETPAIMVSAFTAHGAKTTTEALRLGAFDFILKPTTKSLEESTEQLGRDLMPKVNACRLRQATRGIGQRPSATLGRRPTPGRTAPAKLRLPAAKPGIIVIGISTGGPQALTKLLPRLPKTFPVPIVIVQHMPPMFTKSLADDLDRRCQLTVMEASQGQPVRRGEILIAPGGKQMRVSKNTTGTVIQLTDDPPEGNCRPAVDFLFRSVASNYGPKALGVILTGMGEDGTLGAKQMRSAGASIITQDERTCVVYGMPKSIVDNGLADAILPLEKVHEHLIAAAAGRVTV